MRILFIAGYSASTVYIRARLKPLLSRLAAKGHEITLITLNKGPEPTNKPVFYQYLEVLLKLVGKLRTKYDIILSSKADIPSGIFSFPFSRIRKLPLVIDVDDYETSLFIVRQIIKGKNHEILIEGG